MRSIEELNKLREEARAQIRMRIEQPAVRIIIGSSTAAIAAGTRKVTQAAVEEISKRNIEADIVYDSTVDAEQLPVVKVEKNGEEVCYAGVNEQIMREIVSRHIIGNEVVREYVLQK